MPFAVPCCTSLGIIIIIFMVFNDVLNKAINDVFNFIHQCWTNLNDHFFTTDGYGMGLRCRVPVVCFAFLEYPSCVTLELLLLAVFLVQFCLDLALLVEHSWISP